MALKIQFNLKNLWVLLIGALWQSHAFGKIHPFVIDLDLQAKAFGLSRLESHFKKLLGRIKKSHPAKSQDSFENTIQKSMGFTFL